jgi:hypothetical protein
MNRTPEQRLEFVILREHCVANLATLRSHQGALSQCFHITVDLLLTNSMDEEIEAVIVEIASATDALGTLFRGSGLWTKMNAEVLAYTRPACALVNPDVKGEWRKRGGKTGLREILKAVMFLGMLYKELIAIAENKPSRLGNECTKWVGYAFGIF